jgi:hypothetical protein
MAFLGLKLGMDVNVRHLLQRDLPPFVIASAPQPAPAALKRKADPVQAEAASPPKQSRLEESSTGLLCKKFPDRRFLSIVLDLIVLQQ